MKSLVFLVAVLLMTPSALRALAFSDESLLPHNGVVGVDYLFEIQGRAGEPPYSYKIDSGQLPPGLVLTDRGLISGIPTKAGKYSFWCNLCDTHQKSSQRRITIEIAPASDSAPTTSSSSPLIKPGWILTFFDDFNGKSGKLSDHHWVSSYRGNPKMPAVYAIENGILHLRLNKDLPVLRADGAPGRVSGIETRGAFNQLAQLYGLFEIRARMPKGSGLGATCELAPVDEKYKKTTDAGGTRADANEPRQVDVFEFLGKDTHANNFSAHYGRGESDDEGTDYGHVAFALDLSEDFHLYSLLWTKEALVWSVDGREVFRSDKSPQAPFFLRLNLYEGDTVWRGPVESGGRWPKDLQIDYVRVYEKASDAGAINLP